MAVPDYLKTPQRRINPHRGLVIDVPRWTEAHDYHRAQLARHGMLLHSPGIVSGLDVTAGSDAGAAVVVHPGAALDRKGRLIIVPEAHRLDLSLNSAGVIYVALQYREVPGTPTADAGDELANTMHVLEVYSISGSREAPDGACLELARVQISGPQAAISDAADSRVPVVNEIDLRYRRESGPSASGEVAIGVAAINGQAGADLTNLAGAVDLVTMINRTARFRGRFAGLFDLSGNIEECDLLLMSGREPLSISQDSKDVLRTFIERGAVVFIEHCDASSERGGQEILAFRQSVESLADDLGTPLEPVVGNHPLLSACHRFSGPPAGLGNSGQFRIAGGLVYGEGDYGCLWSGGRVGDQPSRETLRSVTEFGVNLAAYAANRAYSHSLRMSSV